MKNVARILLFPVFLGQIASLAQSLEVGSAEADITPPVGYRMAGYFNERFSTGMHDPLRAKALVLRQGAQQIALVSCDLVGVSLPEHSRSARAGQPPHGHSRHQHRHLRHAHPYRAAVTTGRCANTSTPPP